MAEDPISGSIRTANGDTVALRIGNKSLGGNVVGVIAVLLIAGAALGGAVIAKILFLGQTEGRGQLATITALLTTNNQAVTKGQDALLARILEALRAQDDRVNQQTAAIDARIEKLERYTEAWFTEMAQRDDIHNFNTLNPEQALPLRAPAATVPLQPGGQR
jgi:hypothetical protein